MNVNANPFDRELSRKGLVFQMAKKLVDSIQMEVRTTQPCRKEFDFTVPADVVKSETANTLRDIAAQVALPGFRPGKPTSDFIAKVLNKVTLFGAIYLGIVAICPLIAGKLLGNPSLAIGGTSVIIVVGVALETVRALESQMMMRQYKGFLE